MRSPLFLLAYLQVPPLPMLLGNLQSVEKPPPPKESTWCQASHSFFSQQAAVPLPLQEVNQRAHLFLPGPGFKAPSKPAGQKMMSFYHSDGTRVVQAQGPARRRWASQTSKQSLRKQQLGEHILDPGPVIFWTSKM